MITLDPGSLKARYFRFCLWHPFARGCNQKPPGWYIAHGTTLCHYLWVCVWLPVTTMAVLTAFLSGLIQIFILFHNPGPITPLASVLVALTIAPLAMAAIIGLVVGIGHTGLMGCPEGAKAACLPTRGI